MESGTSLKTVIVAAVGLAKLVAELAEAELGCITARDEAYSRPKQINISRFGSSR